MDEVAISDRLAFCQKLRSFLLIGTLFLVSGCISRPPVVPIPAVGAPAEDLTEAYRGEQRGPPLRIQFPDPGKRVVFYEDSFRRLALYVIEDGIIVERDFFDREAGWYQEKRRLMERFRRFYVEARPNLTFQVRNAILRGDVAVGMTPNDVIASMGRPRRVNRSDGVYGAREQWIYGHTSMRYLYFDQGILRSWQIQDAR